MGFIFHLILALPLLPQASKVIFWLTTTNVDIPKYTKKLGKPNSTITQFHRKWNKQECIQRWSNNLPTAQGADSVLSVCEAADWIKALPTNLLKSLWKACTQTHRNRQAQALWRLLYLLLWLHSRHIHTHLSLYSHELKAGSQHSSKSEK